MRTDARREWEARWRSKNRERLRARANLLNAKNRDRINEKHRAFYRRNRDRIKERCKAYYQRNSARVSTRMRILRATLPDFYIRHLLATQTGLHPQSFPGEFVRAKKINLQLKKLICEVQKT